MLPCNGFAKSLLFSILLSSFKVADVVVQVLDSGVFFTRYGVLNVAVHTDRRPYHVRVERTRIGAVNSHLRVVHCKTAGFGDCKG